MASGHPCIRILTGARLHISSHFCISRKFPGNPQENCTWRLFSELACILKHSVGFPYDSRHPGSHMESGCTHLMPPRQPVLLQDTVTNQEPPTHPSPHLLSNQQTTEQLLRQTSSMDTTINVMLHGEPRLILTRLIIFMTSLLN